MGANATTLELLIQIREELAGLRRTRTELQGAKKDANEFYEAFKSGIGIAGGMQLFSGALSAARGLLQGLVGDVARMAGEIKDSSEALSISTTELQALRIALGNAGLDSSRLSMAIAEQTRSLAEARDTSSGAAQAYRTLGLDAAALERLPVAERLLLTANAANQATDRVLAFSAASNLLGARDLPRLLSALQDVSAGGLTASIATLQAQGEIASPEAISRIDRLTKSWEQYGRQVKVTASELVNFTQAAFEGGAGPDQATIDRIIYGKGQRTPWPWETTPATSTAQPGAAPATAPAPAVDTEAAAAAERRLYVTEQLKRAQADLVTLLDRAGVEQANEALTTEERAGAREQALRDEVAMRTSILELLQQSQQWDFRDNTAKEADIAKAQSELQRAQNALAAQGNTAAQQQVRELFRLETEALAAEAAGNTRIAEQKREQIKQLQLSAQLESQQPELVQARIAAERQLTEAKRTRAAQELDFSRQLGNVEQAIALVEADNALTEEERRRRILPLLAEQNRLIRERIALLEQDTRLQQGDQTALDLQKTIDDLRKQLAETQAQEVDAASPETLAMRDAKGVRSLSDPTQHYQSVADGAAGAGQRFIAQIGTDGDIAAEAISGGLNSALSDTVSWLDQLAQGAITFQEFWSGAIGYVGDMFRKMAIEMVAKMLWRSTVERALVWLGVTTHVQGETAKTAATNSGGAMRMLTWIKEAIVSVYKGAIAAFDAMASIPYVGPVLGAAAMAAAIAGGMALVGKMGKKDGGYGPDIGVNEVAGVYHGGEWIAPNWMVKHPQWGPMIEMLESARTGTASAADLLSTDVTGGIAAPVLAMQASQAAAPAASGSGSSEPINLHVGVMSKQKEAADFFASAQGQKVLIDANRKHAALYG